MSGNRNDVIVSIIDKLEKDGAGKRPCKKTIQKMVYLIQEAGLDLGFGYGIHFYGPYSSELDYEIQDLAATGVLNIEREEFGHYLSSAADENARFQNDEIYYIIDKFKKKSPSQLELLATVLFVQRGKGTDNIIQGVEKIKGSKYSRKQIEAAISELTQAAYF